MASAKITWGGTVRNEAFAAKDHTRTARTSSGMDFRQDHLRQRTVNQHISQITGRLVR